MCGVNIVVSILWWGSHYGGICSKWGLKCRDLPSYAVCIGYIGWGTTIVNMVDGEKISEANNI